VIFDKKAEKLSFEMFPEKLSRLRVFKNHLEKELKQPLTWEQTLEIMLDKIQSPTPKLPKFKRQALNQTNQLCAKCNKPAEHLHHQIPYSISKSHESIIPLCKAHHDLIHHTGNNVTNKQYQLHKRIALKL
jgi:hypothetical protein